MTGPAGLGEGMPDPEQTPETTSPGEDSGLQEPKTAKQDAQEQTESPSSQQAREVLDKARNADESGA